MCANTPFNDSQDRRVRNYRRTVNAGRAPQWHPGMNRRTVEATGARYLAVAGPTPDR